ncbi:MAG: hypothetical protein LBC14_05770 [Desulfovibrio sp.]|nr:hypothetical protein [Desulfovibrio sp.]
MNRKRIAVFLCLLLVSAAAPVWFFVRSAGDGRTRQGEAAERYLRAVYILQSLGGPAAEEKEDIPSRIVNSDESEDLLHHSDKILVLQRSAEELAALGEIFPKAGLFEAYARMGLGEHEAAARLLSRYVAENDYRPAYYALLCDNLAESGDYVSLLLFCREWREKDPSCNRVRARYTLAALYMTGSCADTAAQARAESACLGWEAEVYAAGAAQACGDGEGARRMLQKAESAGGDAVRVQRLWERLRAGHPL